jgi:hypothetical protein
MVDKEEKYWSLLRDQFGPVEPDTEEFLTRSLELSGWYNTGLSSTGSFDVGLMVASPFGMLLDALPIPAMMIDDSFKVAFANQACRTISDNYSIIQGVPFASLVPRQRNSEKALAVLKRVFFTRKSVIAEGILEIDARKVWGRLYFRSIRIGAERYVLVVIEDLTREKARLRVKKKEDDQKDILVSATREKLCKEVWRSERMEGALKYERDKFRKLAGLLGLCTAILGADGAFKHLGPEFKELFGGLIDEFHALRNGKAKLGSRDPRCAEALEWFSQLIGAQELTYSSESFILKYRDGREKKVVCKAVKLESSEYLVACQDLTQKNHPKNQ